MKKRGLILTAGILAILLLVGCTSEAAESSAVESAAGSEQEAESSVAESVAESVTESSAESSEESGEESGTEDPDVIVISPDAKAKVVAELSIDREHGAYYDVLQYADKYGNHGISLNGKFLADKDGNVFYFCGDSIKTVVRHAEDGTDVGSFSADKTLNRPIDEVLLRGGKFLVLYRGGLLAEYDAETGKVSVNTAVRDAVLKRHTPDSVLGVAPEFCVTKDGELLVNCGMYYDLTGKEFYYDEIKTRLDENVIPAGSESGIRIEKTKDDGSRFFMRNAYGKAEEWTVRYGDSSSKTHSLVRCFDYADSLDGEDGKKYSCVTCYLEGEPGQKYKLADADAFFGENGLFYIVCGDLERVRVLCVGKDGQRRLAYAQETVNSVAKLVEERNAEPEAPSARVLPDEIPDVNDGTTLKLTQSIDASLVGNLPNLKMRDGKVFAYVKDKVLYDAKTGEKIVEPGTLHEGYEKAFFHAEVWWFLYEDGCVCSYDPKTKKSEEHIGVSKELPAIDGYPDASWVKGFYAGEGQDVPWIIRYQVTSFYGPGKFFSVDGERVDVQDCFTPGENETAIVNGKIWHAEMQPDIYWNAFRQSTGTIGMENTMWMFIGRDGIGTVSGKLTSVFDRNGGYLGNFYYERVDYRGTMDPEESGTFSIGGIKFERACDATYLLFGGKVFVNGDTYPLIVYDNHDTPFFVSKNGDKWEIYEIGLTEKNTDVLKRLNEVYGVKK